MLCFYSLKKVDYTPNHKDTGPIKLLSNINYIFSCVIVMIFLKTNIVLLDLDDPIKYTCEKKHTEIYSIFSAIIDRENQFVNSSCSMPFYSVIYQHALTSQ